jgi:hypothetical protein
MLRNFAIAALTLACAASYCQTSTGSVTSDQTGYGTLTWAGHKNARINRVRLTLNANGNAVMSYWGQAQGTLRGWWSRESGNKLYINVVRANNDTRTSLAGSIQMNSYNDFSSIWLDGDVANRGFTFKFSAANSSASMPRGEVMTVSQGVVPVWTRGFSRTVYGTGKLFRSNHGEDRINSARLRLLNNGRFALELHCANWGNKGLSGTWSGVRNRMVQLRIDEGLADGDTIGTGTVTIANDNRRFARIRFSGRGGGGTFNGDFVAR